MKNREKFIKKESRSFICIICTIPLDGPYGYIKESYLNDEETGRLYEILEHPICQLCGSAKGWNCKPFYMSKEMVDDQDYTVYCDENNNVIFRTKKIAQDECDCVKKSINASIHK